MASKKLINISNLQKFLSKLNEKFALKKTMKGISEDAEGNIIIGEEGLVPTPNENSKGKFLRSDGEWALPSETAVYDSMTIEEGIAGVSEVDRVINAKNLKQIVNSDGFLTSLDSSKLTGVINIENLPQGALERILIVSSKEERLTLSDTEVNLGDVVKEADTGLMYYVINTEKLNSEEGYTQFTAGMASSVPWSGVTDKPTIPTKTSDLTNDSGFAIDNDVVHTSGNETINGVKTFTSEVYRMNNAVDRTTIPSQNLYSSFTFLDKARLSVGSIQHCKRTSGINDISLYVTGHSDVPYGVRINSNKEFNPIENNAYSLGNAGTKWANVYTTRLNGNLKLPKFDGELLGTTFVKFNNGWYRKHSDGFIEQFIYINSTNSLSEMKVNFAIPFTTKNYHVSVIGSRTDSTDPGKTDDLVFTTCVKDKTYVNIYKYDCGHTSYSTSMTVYVCGY